MVQHVVFTRQRPLIRLHEQIQTRCLCSSLSRPGSSHLFCACLLGVYFCSECMCFESADHVDVLHATGRFIRYQYHVQPMVCKLCRRPRRSDLLCARVFPRCLTAFSRGSPDLPTLRHILISMVFLCHVVCTSL